MLFRSEDRRWRGGRDRTGGPSGWWAVQAGVEGRCCRATRRKHRFVAAPRPRWTKRPRQFGDCVSQVVCRSHRPRFHQPAHARPAAERGEERKWRGDGLGGGPWRGWGETVAEPPNLEYGAATVFPCGGRSRWVVNPGSRTGRRSACGVWRYRMHVECGRWGRMVGSGQAKPYRLPGPFGVTNPG